MGEFSADPIQKAVLSFINSLTEYVKGDVRHSEHFYTQKKCSHGVCAVLNS